MAASKKTMAEAIVAPIIIDASAGLIILRDSRDDVLRMLGDPEKGEQIKMTGSHAENGWVERWHYGPIKVFLDAGQSVYRIAVFGGYQGKIRDTKAGVDTGVGIGTPFSELTRLYGPGRTEEIPKKIGMLWTSPNFAGTVFILKSRDEALYTSGIVLTFPVDYLSEPENPFPKGGSIDTRKRALVHY